MSRWEVKIAGFGGQGIILAGYLLGKAAAVYDRRHATMVQSYGPEARGSACNSQVIIACLLYTSPSPRDVEESRMPSSA